MAADASIYGQIQPIRPRNALADYAAVAQIQGVQGANALNTMKMDALRREQADSEALSAAYAGAVGADGTINRNALLTRLATGGQGAKIPGVQKSFAEQDKATAELDETREKTRKSRLESSLSRLKLYRDAALGAADPDGAVNLVDSMLSDPDLKDTPIGRIPREQWLPKSADPAGFEQWKQQFALGATKFIEMNAPKITTQNLGGTSRIVATPGLGGAPQVLSDTPVTMTPGEVAADERARATLTETKRHNQVTEGAAGLTYDSERGVVVDKRSGQVRPVTAAPGQSLPPAGAGKPLTEGQAKANLFGQRMAAADKLLTALEDDGVKDTGIIKSTVQGVAGLTPFMGDKMSEAAGSVMTAVPRFLGGPNQRQLQVEQARRDFINAVLRKESGAVISPQEFANAEKQYFPQLGEGPDVIRQKQDARRRATELMLAEVPGNPRGGNAAPAGSAPAAPKVLRFDANGNPIP